MRSIGMDVHRDFCEVALVEDGALRSAGRIEASPEAVGVFADSLCATDEVVLGRPAARSRSLACWRHASRGWCSRTPPMCARSPTRA
jgi:hypothetical protein